MKQFLIITAILALSGLEPSVATAQHGMPGGTPMTFFVTSESIGDGGNLGGLAGADAHCQSLAETVGAGDRTWRAYLSTQARPGQPAINARDRIGTGPLVQLRWRHDRPRRRASSWRYAGTRTTW